MDNGAANQSSEQSSYRRFEHRANLAREHGDGTPSGESPLATSSFRVYHGRRMSNAIVVADSRVIEHYHDPHGKLSPRPADAHGVLPLIDERVGY